MAGDIGEISLRPLALRPGGGGKVNPFAGFAKGAGASVRSKVRPASARGKAVQECNC
jgi:hypothetical protein